MSQSGLGAGPVVSGFAAWVSWRGGYWSKQLSYSNMMLVPMFWCAPPLCEFRSFGSIARGIRRALKCSTRGTVARMRKGLQNKLDLVIIMVQPETSRPCPFPISSACPTTVNSTKARCSRAGSKPGCLAATSAAFNHAPATSNETLFIKFNNSTSLSLPQERGRGRAAEVRERGRWVLVARDRACRPRPMLTPMTYCVCTS